jgi:hypothetical protein
MFKGVERGREMNIINSDNMCVCREIVTKERLYERLNNAIKECEMNIMREEAKLETLIHTKRNLDEYFEDLCKAESEGK